MANTTKCKSAAKHQRNTSPEPQGQTATAGKIGGEEQSPSTATKPERQSKASLVLDLLLRPEGATIDQIVAVTGWLPHTTRAALTGLKKKGHAITSDKVEGGARTYRATRA